MAVEADVDVGVVADHLAVADRTEQGAVAEVGVDAGLLPEHVEHLDGGLQDLLLELERRVQERAAEVADLVHRERLTDLVDHRDPFGRGAELVLGVEPLLLTRDVGEPDPGRAVEEADQVGRPRDEDAAAPGLTVADRGEGPDVASVELDGDRFVRCVRQPDPLGGDHCSAR